MPAIAKQLQVVTSYADALRYQRLNQRVFQIVAEDERLIKDAAATVGVPERVAAEAIRSVGKNLAKRGLAGVVPQAQLRTQILEAIVRHSRFHDMTEQTWTKLVQRDGRMLP